MAAFELIEWKPIVRKSLVGQALVRMGSGMQILTNVFKNKDGQGYWASPVQYRSRGGAYEPVVSFVSKDREQAWQTAVVACCSEAIKRTEANPPREEAYNAQF